MKISTCSRIHFSLLDLAGVSQRNFGGVGIALKQPRTTIEAVPAKNLQLSGFDALDDTAQNDVNELLIRLRASETIPGLKLALLDHAPQHRGFGSKTSLMMSLATLINRHAGLKLSRQELQKLSGRGGASGVGIHAFFEGGLVADGGHQRTASSAYRPSGGRAPLSLPPMLLRTVLPADWKIALFLPVKGRIYKGTKEAKFFAENTPIDDEECLRAIAAVYHGLMPAIVEGRIEAVKEALDEINSVGFKKREIEGQSQEVRSALEYVGSHRLIAAGMSSLGPLVYAIFDSSIKECRDHILRLAETDKLGFIGCTQVDYSGHAWD